MYQPDPFSRVTRTSLELSRRAAERHAHLEALARPETGESPGRRRRRPQEWLRVMLFPALR